MKLDFYTIHQKITIKTLFVFCEHLHKFQSHKTQEEKIGDRRAMNNNEQQRSIHNNNIE